MDTDMDMAPIGHRAVAGFPVSTPTEALRKDHEFVRNLFSRYLDTRDDAVREEAGPRILALLEMHTSLEESVFYPQVRQLDASLIQECIDEHSEAEQLIHLLKGMDPTSAEAEPIFRRLCETVLQHIDNEEHRLFPQVEQSALDLEHIGLQMQAYEANLVSTQAREWQERHSR